MTRTRLCLALLPALLLLAVGIVGITLWLRPQGAAARCPEERLVRDYILSHAPDPRTVEFVQWGPHDLTGKLGWHWTSVEHAAFVFVKISPPVSGPVPRLVRVQYRVQFGFQDDLFAIHDGKILGTVGILGPLVLPNPTPIIGSNPPVGDHWQDALRKQVEQSQQNIIKTVLERL